MTTIKQIAEALKQGKQIPPNTLAEWRGVLAGEYSFAAGSLEDVLKQRPFIWNKLHETNKTDKGTDRAWEQTEEGINEMGLRLRMKAIEKLMSALKGLQDLAEGQARNQF